MTADEPVGAQGRKAPEGAQGDAPTGAGSTSRGPGAGGDGAGSTARAQGVGGEGVRPVRRERRQVLLRLDPAVHDALAKWAADDLRSVNAQIDLLLRRALKDAGRMPDAAGAPPRRGRPPST